MRQRGDTIIEVMLAFVVFSMVAIGALTVMNKGLASAQQSLEATLVRQQMDGQAELLRYLHGAYSADPGQAESAKYTSLIARAVDTATTFGDQSCTEGIPSVRNSEFIIDPYTVEIKDGSSILPVSNENAPAFAQITHTGGVDRAFDRAYGLWIEPVSGDSDSSGQGFIDFHIRACWYSPASNAVQTLGTIVRLYTPRVD